MEIRHNKTKQDRFPTTRREGVKSWKTWITFQVFSGLVGPSTLQSEQVHVLVECVRVTLKGGTKV